uniref:Uncharacterized protein n=1 Tax=Musa acuminata subsp. malaccensis TaxID=214687 RepID=A0A804IP71_MUSAM
MKWKEYSVTVNMLVITLFSGMCFCEAHIRFGNSSITLLLPKEFKSIASVSKLKAIEHNCFLC